MNKQKLKRLKRRHKRLQRKYKNRAEACSHLPALVRYHRLDTLWMKVIVAQINLSAERLRIKKNKKTPQKKVITKIL